MFSLSIIIPNYNGLRHLQRCLPSVVRFAPAGTQIVVVDDRSTDNSVQWVRKHFPQVDLVQLPVNKGFCQAVNEGLRHASGDVVEFLNNDTEVTKGWAAPCLEQFKDPTVGSVAPLVLRMDNPEIIDSAGQDYHICGWARDRGHGMALNDDYLDRREIFGASGSSGFYRRDVLREIGGLLPDYGAYFEDTDLAFRLRWAGYRCMYEPSSRVLHKGSASYAQQSNRVIQLLARNEELAYWINLTTWQLALGLVPHIGFNAVRLAKKILNRRFAPFIKGKMQAMGHWRQILQRRKELQALARKNGRAIDLGVSKNASVMRRGLIWLSRRKCA